jgi:NAD(P)-dependent dehydrogenase (short-subunit alcohol dehydrogenase family)
MKSGKNRVCIITGGGSGIGRALALRLAQAGAQVVLVGRALPKLEDTAAACGAVGAAPVIYSLDVADKPAVEKMVAEVVDRFGKIDALINNAGHSSAHRGLLSTTPEDIKSVLDSNLVGTIYCTQAALPAMLRAKAGIVVNISSRSGTHPGLLGGMIYSAAKAAVINFTGFLREEFKNSGVRFSVVIPGEVDTPIIDKRPIPPDPSARETMVPADEAADVIASLIELSGKTSIPEIQILPTYLRDVSAELKK